MCNNAFICGLRHGAEHSVQAKRASLLYCPAPSRGSYSGTPGGSGPSIAMLYRATQSAFVGMPTLFFSSSVENSTCPAKCDKIVPTSHPSLHVMMANYQFLYVAYEQCHADSVGLRARGTGWDMGEGEGFSRCQHWITVTRDG